MADAVKVDRRVVVVGAGAVGLAVGLQLRRAGAQRVLVVDRLETPGMGSTSRANGGVRAQWGTAINVEFSRFTIGALRDLNERTGGVVGLKQVGYLFLTGTEFGEAVLRENLRLQNSLGVLSRWLSPEAALATAPFVEQAGLRGATFCPTDGLIDPHGVVTALWSEGRRLGVEYRFGVEVIGLEPRGEGPAGRVDGPMDGRVDGAEIEADIVVNAAGPYAAQVAALAGIELPVRPYRRNLACTEPVSGYPDPIPMCVDLDTGVLIRREGGGFLLAYSDPAEPSSFETAFDPRFLAAVADRIGNRFSFLAGVPIDEGKCWAGLYPETVDHHSIIDAAPGLPEFIQCAGFGGHGIMHSLAAGQAVAELVCSGACTTFDIWPLRLTRFEEGDLTVERAVL